MRFCVWWRHQMETVSTLLALCAGNSPVTGEFASQKPVTRSFDVFFDLCLKNGWANNPYIGDLRCHWTHYDVTVMGNRKYVDRNSATNPGTTARHDNHRPHSAPPPHLHPFKLVYQNWNIDRIGFAPFVTAPRKHIFGSYFTRLR